MHIMFMIFILVLVYFSSLIIMCIYRDKINIDIANATFIILIFASFATLNIHYFRNGGLKDFMTLDNISPLTFTLAPLSYVMNEKIKKCYFSMVAFLSFGMFVAMLVNPNYAYLFSFKQNATLDYAYDSISHLFCSLFGIFLVISGQIKIKPKNLLYSMIFVYSIVTYGVILNIIFHKSNFGMNPYGKASIYMFDFFSNFYVTLIAYYFGIAVVLIIGYQLTYFLDKASKHILHEENNKPV